MVRNSIHRIRAELRKPGVTKKGLAEKAGLHANTLQGCEREDWNPTAATLLALETAITEESPSAADDTPAQQPASPGKSAAVTGLGEAA